MSSDFDFEIRTSRETSQIVDRTTFMTRLFNPAVKPSTRFYQVVNGSLMPWVGRPLGIVHVVEFPKSGGSWIRDMIRGYLGSGPYFMDRFLFRNAVIHTHRRYSRTFPRPVLVVRDPRDVYTSFYHHEVNLEGRRGAPSIERPADHRPSQDVREDFGRYLEAKLLDQSHPWFYYSQLVESWIRRPNVCLVRYEDFIADPEEQLIRVMRFLRKPVDLAKVREVVEFNSFRNQTRILYGKERAAGESDPSKFLRKGVVGDWVNHFDERSCRLLQKTEGPTLKLLGYEDDDSWIERFVSETHRARSSAA